MERQGENCFFYFAGFYLIVIAALQIWWQGTFNAYTVADGAAVLSPAAQTNGAAGSISLLFIVFAMIFGVIQKKTTVKGLEENGSGTGLYGGCSWDWNGISAGSRKGYLVLSDLCIYLHGSRAPHVASDAARII